MSKRNQTERTLLGVGFLILLLLALWLRSKVESTQAEVNALKTELKNANELKNEYRRYAMQLEKICERFKSSRDAKYNYHLTNKTNLE